MHLSSASLLFCVFWISGWRASSLDFVTAGWAFPAVESRGEPESGKFLVIPLSRRRAAEQDRRRMVSQRFDPVYAKTELAGLVFKYRDASSYLNGLVNQASHNAPLDDVQGQSSLRAPRNASSSIHAVQSPDLMAYSSANIDAKVIPKIPPVQATSGEAEMSLTDMISGSMDLLYYGPLRFGTPPQELTIDVDTGSADLWIPAGCSTCSNKQFDKKASSTYSESKSTFDVTYGTGGISAVLATDIVTLQGLSIHNQSFGAVNQESNDFNSYPNSGLLGTAFSSIAASGEPTFLENLIQQKQLAAPMFSVYLERGEENGSEVCFGCIDDDKMFGPVHWVPVVSKTYWTIAMDRVSLNSTAITTPGVIAAVDTGTTLIYLPQKIAESLYNTIPGSKPAAEYGPAFFTIPCDSHFTISFSFGGGDFAIDNRDFILGSVDGDVANCMGGIVGLEDDFPDNLAIMGDEFLKSWYSTFDYSNGARVGLSANVNNKT